MGLCHHAWFPLASESKASPSHSLRTCSLSQYCLIGVRKTFFLSPNPTDILRDRGSEFSLYLPKGFYSSAPFSYTPNHNYSPAFSAIYFLKCPPKAMRSHPQILAGPTRSTHILQWPGCHPPTASAKVSSLLALAKGTSAMPFVQIKTSPVL